MEEPTIELAHRITEEVEEFLLACKEKDNITIGDVLKRLESLKEQT